MDARKWLPSFAVIFLALCTIVRESLAIKCYMCNSKRNTLGCDSLDKENMHKLIQDCDELPKAVHGEANYTVCRKMVQTIFDEDGNDSTRVIRQCGTAGKIGCHRQTRPGTLQVRTCHCDQDLCNAATSLQRPLLVYFLMLTSCSVLYRLAAHFL